MYTPDIRHTLGGDCEAIFSYQVDISIKIQQKLKCVVKQIPIGCHRFETPHYTAYAKIRPKFLLPLSYLWA